MQSGSERDWDTFEPPPCALGMDTVGGMQHRRAVILVAP